MTKHHKKLFIINILNVNQTFFLDCLFLIRLWNISILLIICDWINNPTRIFSKRFLYVWYNRNIDWFKYIINITLINNCFCFWVRLKGAIFCFFVTFYFLKASLVTNSNSLNSDNESISFFLTADSVSLSCSSGLKELKGSIL